MISLSKSWKTTGRRIMVLPRPHCLALCNMVCFLCRKSTKQPKKFECMEIKCGAKSSTDIQLLLETQYLHHGWGLWCCVSGKSYGSCCKIFVNSWVSSLTKYRCLPNWKYSSYMGLNCYFVKSGFEHWSLPAILAFEEERKKRRKGSSTIVVEGRKAN